MPPMETRLIPTRGPRVALTVACAIGGWSEAKLLAQEAGGARPVARLLEAAIHHAREGVPVTNSQARLTKDGWPDLQGVAGFRENYAAGGPPAEGSILFQKKLAQSLQRISDAGLDDFYRGDLARTLATGLEAADSPLRLHDLEKFQPKRVAPAKARLRKTPLYNMPPPTQGISSLMILKMFQALGVHQVETFEHVQGLVEATKRAFLIRNAHVVDPERMGDVWKSWLTDDMIAKEAAAINMAKAAPCLPAALPGDTIWMRAADRNGNVVSYIQSIFLGVRLRSRSAGNRHPLAEPRCQLHTSAWAK
ncbi:MAG: gamma-glutamyltransferase [Filomicrobium sp.]